MLAPHLCNSPCFTPVPLWVKVALQPGLHIIQTLIKSPLMRWTKYLTSSQPARATSTSSPCTASPPSSHSPCVLPTAACLLVSDWCFHSNGRVEVFRPVAFCSAHLASCCLFSVAVLFCLVEYPHGPSTGKLRVCRLMPNPVHHALDPPMEAKLWLA